MRCLAIAAVALLLEAAAVPQADEFRKNLKGRTDAKEATKASMNKAPKLSSCASRSSNANIHWRNRFALPCSRRLSEKQCEDGISDCLWDFNKKVCTNLESHSWDSEMAECGARRIEPSGPRLQNP